MKVHKQKNLTLFFMILQILLTDLFLGITLLVWFFRQEIEQNFYSLKDKSPFPFQNQTQQLKVNQTLAQPHMELLSLRMKVDVRIIQNIMDSTVA